MDSIIAVIDCEQLPNLQGRNQLLALEQIGVADLILLNKVDLADPIVVTELQTWIRRINANARFLETVNCEAPLPLLLGVGNFAPDRLVNRTTLDIHVHPEGETHDHAHDHEHDHEHDHDSPESGAGHRHGHEAQEHQHTDHSLLFSTWLYESAAPLNFKALRRTVEKLPHPIFRAKGFIRLDAPANRRALLQMVGSRVRLTLGELWAADETPRTQLVFIGEPGSLDPAELQERFDRCRPGEGSIIRDLWEDTVDFVRSF